MLVSENFLMPNTQIAHKLAMLSLHVSLKMRPALAGSIASLVGTVVPEQENCVLEDAGFLKLNPQVLVDLCEITIVEVLKWFVGSVGKDYERSLCLCSD